MMTPGLLTAFVVGSTGEVGKVLVEKLAAHSQFEQITLISRRKIELPKDFVGSEKIEQRIVDFEHLDDYAGAFEGHDIGFCALGTTKKKAGKDGFYRVDHDYVVQSLKLAKTAGCKHVHLVSSASANKNSVIYYSKVKGQVESEASEMGFERLSIYRPGLLICSRTEVRTGEKVAQFLFKPLDYWRHLSIEVPILVTAMVNNCFLPSSASAVEILENRAIYSLGAQQNL